MRVFIKVQDKMKSTSASKQTFDFEVKPNVKKALSDSDVDCVIRGNTVKARGMDNAFEVAKIVLENDPKVKKYVDNLVYSKPRNSEESAYRYAIMCNSFLSSNEILGYVAEIIGESYGEDTLEKIAKAIFESICLDVSSTAEALDKGQRIEPYENILGSIERDFDNALEFVNYDELLKTTLETLHAYDSPKDFGAHRAILRAFDVDFEV